VIETPPNESEVLFCLRTIRWRDATGERFGAQYEDCELPQEYVARAISSGACVRVSDPRRKELLGVRGGRHVDPRAPDIFDFGSGIPYIGPSDANNDVLRGANFQVLPARPDRVLKIAGPSL
jgi:hypothetical protein